MKEPKYAHRIILVDKPEGLTSFEVVARVKGIAGTRKVGHSGTLDRFASGLLVICTGKMTKLTQYFLESDKRYRALIQLGCSTETDDSEGGVVHAGDFTALSRDDIEKALMAFRGSFDQAPPLYSALKVKGRRASDRVRDGEEVNLASRQVTVHKIELGDYDSRAGKIDCVIDCSKGTYIRSIARDLGKALGCGAHLAGLRRLRSGVFSVEDAVSLEELEQYSPGEEEVPFLPPPVKALVGFGTVVIDEETVGRVLTGAFFSRDEVISLEKEEKKRYVIIDKRKNLIAIADIDTDKWHINYRNVLGIGKKEL